MSTGRLVLMSLGAVAGFLVGAALGFYLVIATVDWHQAFEPQLVVATVGLGSLISTLTAVAVAPDRARRWPLMVVPALSAAVISGLALMIADAGPVLLILAALVVSAALVAGANGTE